MNIPNTITWLRIFVTGVIVLLLYQELFLLAFVLFLLASISDYFDGYFARKLNQVTKLGKVLDQMSDKILITSVLVVFVEFGLVPGWLVVVTIFRDTLVSTVRMVASTSGEVIAANYFGKIKTVSQMILVIGLFLYELSKLSAFQILNNVLIYVVLVSTLFSGAIYIYGNRKYLGG